MEVVVLGTDGIPQDSILSIRAGATRRQCVVSGVDKPFKFPISPEAAGTVKIDVLSVTGCTRALCDKGERDYTLNLKKAPTAPPSAPEAEGSISFKIRPAPPSSEKVPMVPLPEKKPQDKSDAWSSAEAYLQENSIMSLLQGILQSLIKEKPPDPYAFIAQQFGYQPPGPSAEEEKAMKEETREALVKAAQSGTLAKVLQAGQPKPASEAVAVQDLRLQARQVLVQSAESGSLLDVLQKRKDEKSAAPETQESLTDLREQARQALVKSAESGDLKKLLTSKAAVAAGAEELGNLKMEARNALVKSVEAGNLLDALERIRTPGDDGDTQDLRSQAREALVAGAESGLLVGALKKTQVGGSGTADDEMTAARLQAREVLLKGAQSGSLQNLLSTLSPGDQAQAAEVAQLRQDAKDALIRGTDDGSLLKILKKEVPDCDGLKMQARQVLVKGLQSGGLKTLLLDLMPAQTAEVGQLQQQARETLAKCTENGSLLKMLTQPSAATDELARLRQQAREVLVSGIESGTLMDVFEKSQKAPPPEAAQISRDEVMDLKRQARQALATSAQKGQLSNVLKQSKEQNQEEVEVAPALESRAVAAKPDPEIVSLKRQAREALAKSAESGGLSQALAKRPISVTASEGGSLPVSPSRPESRQEARLREGARKSLLQGFGDGNLVPTLEAVQGPPQDDIFMLRRQAYTVFANAHQKGQLEKALEISASGDMIDRASDLLMKSAGSGSLASMLKDASSNPDEAKAKARQALLESAHTGKLATTLKDEFEPAAPEPTGEMASTIIRREGSLATAMKRMTTAEFRELREEAGKVGA